MNGLNTPPGAGISFTFQLLSVFSFMCSITSVSVPNFSWDSGMGPPQHRCYGSCTDYAETVNSVVALLVQVLVTGFLLTSEVFPRLFILFYDHVHHSFSFVYFVLCSCVFTFVMYRFRAQCIYEGWYSGMGTLGWTNPGYIITILSSHHLAYAFTRLI